jgi:hypothetical protein
MTKRALGAALGAAVYLFATAGMTTTGWAQAAQFVSCPAPIAHCVHSVSGWCEKEPNGKIMIVFYDRSMSGERYRQCLNDALAKRGQQKPAPKR